MSAFRAGRDWASKISGWLWAWLKEYWDWAGSIAAFACLLAFLGTHQVLFLIAGGCLSLTALCSPPGCLHEMWLRLPPVEWYLHRRRKRARRDGPHPAVQAAAQREIDLLDEWWDLPATDDVRKEQSSE
jgi:hypothetical protein